MKKSLSGSYLSLAKNLPINENDILFIASDVTQLALTARSSGERFDANAFIESFQSVLKNGTLIVPAYTDLLKNGDTFNHSKAKPTTGALSNKVFRRKDFIRTKDPLHSVFVWGKHQQELSSLDGNSSLGEGSIFEWLHKHQAKMICIDVHYQNSLTFVHYVEELRKVKYRKPYNWRIKRVFRDSEDEEEFVFYSRKNWVLTDLELLQNSSIDKGIGTKYDHNGTDIIYFELEQMYSHINGMLDRGEKLHKISLVHFAKEIARKLLGKH